MGVFDWSSTKEQDQKAKGKGSEENDEDEIPIICDAVVVRADEEAPSQAPPAMNPNHTMVTYQQQQQQEPPPQMMRPEQAVKFSSPTPFFNVGRSPIGLQCPHCHRQTITVVQDLIGMGTLIAVFILALFFWPICWLPFCIPSCQRSHHYCGHAQCRKKIGETSVCA